jgi:hypothetical protein
MVLHAAARDQNGGVSYTTSNRRAVLERRRDGLARLDQVDQQALVD